jgi:hypothetical protein
MQQRCKYMGWRLIAIQLHIFWQNRKRCIVLMSERQVFPTCPLSYKHGPETGHPPGAQSPNLGYKKLIYNYLCLLAQALKKGIAYQRDTHLPMLPNCGLVIDLCEFIG